MINYKFRKLSFKNDKLKFYTRPKINKTGNLDAHYSSFNCHTNTISKHVDFHLQPIIKNIISYVIGTKDFLQKLDKVKIFATLTGKP